MTTSRTLVLMRHAKAEPTAPTDRDRPLSARGRDEARAAGEWLRSRGLRPDAALVSEALRTRETWDQVVAESGWEVAPELSAALYAADPQAALDLICATAPDAECLLVIGHNPTIAYVAQLLDDGSGDADATDAMITGGYPPCTLTVFDVTGEWSDLHEGARLVAHRVPRG